MEISLHSEERWRGGGEKRDMERMEEEKKRRRREEGRVRGWRRRRGEGWGYLL